MSPHGQQRGKEKRLDRRIAAAHSFAALLRHPLVVGAALALSSGILASLVIPALTRVWQDRPRELALKRELVDKIAEASTSPISKVRLGDLLHTPFSASQRQARYQRLESKWDLDGAIILSELTTYFQGTNLPGSWRDYQSAIHGYLDYYVRHSRFAMIRIRLDLRHAHFPIAWQEEARLEFLQNPVHGFDTDREIELYYVLTYWRDAISSRIVESNASGFSHGFWIFR
jgi:hypothetical protein